VADNNSLFLSISIYINGISLVAICRRRRRRGWVVLVCGIFDCEFERWCSRYYGMEHGGWMAAGMWPAAAAAVMVRVMVKRFMFMEVLVMTSSRQNPLTTNDARKTVVSKLIEFVCPSSTRHRSAGSVIRSMARQIVSKLIEFV
jgi:hypothetical protein